MERKLQPPKGEEKYGIYGLGAFLLAVSLLIYFNASEANKATGLLAAQNMELIKFDGNQNEFSVCLLVFGVWSRISAECRVVIYSFRAV